MLDTCSLGHVQQFAAFLAIWPVVCRRCARQRAGANEPAPDAHTTGLWRRRRRSSNGGGSKPAFLLLEPKPLSLSKAAKNVAAVLCLCNTQVDADRYYYYYYSSSSSFPLSSLASKTLPLDGLRREDALFGLAKIGGIARRLGRKHFCCLPAGLLARLAMCFNQITTPPSLNLNQAARMVSVRMVCVRACACVCVRVCGCLFATISLPTHCPTFLAPKHTKPVQIGEQ